MISVECGVRVVQFIGICHWRLFGTSRVMPVLAKFIFVFAASVVLPDQMHTLSLVRYRGELMDSD